MSGAEMATGGQFPDPEKCGDIIFVTASCMSPPEALATRRAVEDLISREEKRIRGCTLHWTAENQIAAGNVEVRVSLNDLRAILATLSVTR